MFGLSDDEVTDKALIQAVRKRLKKQLDDNGSGSGANSIINNLYGGGGGEKSSLQDVMNGGDDPFEYMVDIARTSDPGNPKDWKKSVHRYRAKKGKD